MKTCKSCGFLLNDGDRFCTHCGVVQEETIEVTKANAEEPKKEEPIFNEPVYDYTTRYEESTSMPIPSKKPLILGIIGTAVAIFTLLMWVESIYIILPELFKTEEFTKEFDAEMLEMIWKAEVGVFTFVAVAGGIAGCIMGTIGITKKNGMKVGRIFSIIAIAAGVFSTILTIVLAATNI